MDIRKIIREEIEKIMSPEEERREEVYLNMSDYDIMKGDDAIGRIFAFVKEKQKIIHLSEIRIFDEYLRKGYGTEAMKKLIDFADEKGYTISLTPSDSFGTSVSFLKKWYKSLGFVENKGRNKDYEISDTMYRLSGVSEIDLSIGHSPGVKPGIVRKFPQQKKGGHSLNLSVDDGPHQFPQEEDF